MLKCVLSSVIVLFLQSFFKIFRFLIKNILAFFKIIKNFKTTLFCKVSLTYTQIFLEFLQNYSQLFMKVFLKVIKKISFIYSTFFLSFTDLISRYPYNYFQVFCKSCKILQKISTYFHKNCCQ